jgi:DNA-binding transcriptional LysR family regulator
VVELRQLEYAVAVAEELHFGRAAARLQVAQQSVSQQIQRLERELGGPLFQRTSRRVQLTPVGEAFIPQARDALAQARHALAVGRRVAHGHAGEVLLGYVANLWPQLVRVVLPALAARHPELHVLPQAMHTLEQVAALRGGRLDVGLTWHPDPGEDLDAYVLALVPFLAVLPHGHPLAGKQHLARRDLVGQPLVALVPHADHPRLHEHLLRQLRTEPDGSQVPLTVAADEPFTLERMLPLVVAGTGIGLLPLTLAAEVPNQDVVLCPFADQPPSASVTLLWRRDDTRPSVAKVTQTLRQLGDQGAFLPESPLADDRPGSSGGVMSSA